jgi:hypothetical protein
LILCDAKLLEDEQQMKVGVGLPNTLMPQIDRRLFLDWARKADAAGFSTLATTDARAGDRRARG